MADKIRRGEEEVSSATGVGALRSGTIQLIVEEGITAKSVHESLDRIFRLHGCRACGLAGLDLRFRVQDTLLVETFRDIKGVQDVTILR